jgi:hypothetical protein
MNKTSSQQHLLFSETIILESGELCPIEQLESGMRLLGENGETAELLGIEKRKTVFYVVRTAGPGAITFTARYDQFLCLYNMGTGECENIRMQDFFYLPGLRQKEYSLHRAVVELPERTLDVAPYLMGFLLGGAALRQTAPNVTISDPRMLEKIKEIVAAHGWNYSISEAPRQRRFFFKKSPGKPSLRDYCEEFGLLDVSERERFIPPLYLCASRQQRRELLAGIMDNLGGFARNTFLITTCSERFAKDISYLANSVGLFAYTIALVRGRHCCKIKGNFADLPLDRETPTAKYVYDDRKNDYLEFSLVTAHIGELYYLNTDRGYITGDLVVHKCVR